ncbi:MAG: 50S ribosomal protein L9 [Verrucomicrobiales bacterium]
MATTEIILTEKIHGLGVEADVVSVKRGYAANYLIPQGKAYVATSASLKLLESLKIKRAEREAKEHVEAEALATRIRKTRITLELATGSQGKAFGSVTNMDIAKALEEKGFEIDRHHIELKAPIKNTGDFDIDIRIHPEISAKLHIVVKAKEAPGSQERTEKESTKDAESDKE